MALKRLEAHHLLAIEWLSKVKFGGKTKKQIAEEICQVSEQSLYNWLKDPLFERELKKAISRSVMDRLPEVFESIPDHIIKGGNAAMLKTLLQSLDMLTDRVEIEQKSGNDTPDIEELKRMLSDED